MSAPTRIYLVVDKATGTKRLAKAGNKAQALRAVTSDQFSVDVASQEDLVNLISTGAQVLDATKVVEDIDASTTPETQA